MQVAGLHQNPPFVFSTFQNTFRFSSDKPIASHGLDLTTGPRLPLGQTQACYTTTK